VLYADGLQFLNERYKKKWQKEVLGNTGTIFPTFTLIPFSLFCVHISYFSAGKAESRALVGHFIVTHPCPESGFTFLGFNNNCTWFLPTILTEKGFFCPLFPFIHLSFFMRFLFEKLRNCSQKDWQLFHSKHRRRVISTRLQILFWLVKSHVVVPSSIDPLPPPSLRKREREKERGMVAPLFRLACIQFLPLKHNKGKEIKYKSYLIFPKMHNSWKPSHLPPISSSFCRQICSNEPTFLNHAHIRRFVVILYLLLLKPLLVISIKSLFPCELLLLEQKGDRLK